MKRDKTYWTYGTLLREIIYVSLDSQKKRRRKKSRKLKEIMTEIFPNLERDLNIQVDEAIRSPQNFNPK